MGFLVQKIRVGIVIGIPIVVSVIMEFFANRTEAKRKKAHPLLWQKFDKNDEKTVEEIRWHNNEVANIKEKIDFIISQWKYYTKETRLEKRIELEQLRDDLAKAEQVNKENCSATKAVREKIHKYVADNELKWAKKWGW